MNPQMNALLFLIVSFITFMYSAWFSYFWWFKSKKYLSLNRKDRKEYRRKYFPLPRNLMSNYYAQNPETEIWMNRLASVFILAGSVFGIFIGIQRLFG